MRENPKNARKAAGLTQQQVAKKRNLNWVILAIPENCHNIFICMDEKLFDEKTKNGMIPLHDDRNYGGHVSMPCFIGYVPTSDQTDLDKLVEIQQTKQDEVPEADRRNHVGTKNPIQELCIDPE